MKIGVSVVVGLLFAVILASSIGHGVFAAGGTVTIIVGTSPTCVAYDSAQGEMYVVNSVSGDISVVNDTNNHSVTNITGLSYKPDLIVYDSAKGEMFVTTGGGVSVINCSTNSIIASIPLESCTGVAYDSGKGEIFVTDVDLSQVSVINDTTNQVVKNITLFAPYQLLYDPNKGEIFVSMGVGINMSVISDATNTDIKNITVKSSGQGDLAYDSAKREIFVVTGNNVTVISDSTNSIATTIKIGNPGVIAYDPVEGAILVSNHVAATYVVDVISDNTNTVASNVTVGSGPSWAAYDSGKGETWITNYNANTVSIIPDTEISVPEFSSVALFAVVMIALTTVAVTIAKRKSIRLPSNSK